MWMQFAWVGHKCGPVKSCRLSRLLHFTMCSLFFSSTNPHLGYSSKHALLFSLDHMGSSVWALSANWLFCCNKLFPWTWTSSYTVQLLTFENGITVASVACIFTCCRCNKDQKMEILTITTFSQDKMATINMIKYV